MKAALVVGSTGQDGTLLTSQLVDAGWLVIGVSRTGVTESAGIRRGLTVRLSDLEDTVRFIEEVHPMCIFYLAAFHHSSEEKIGPATPELLQRSYEVHVHAFANILEAAAMRVPTARIFYASSSHVFGDPPHDRQDENTPFAPISAYGITKAAGVEVARLYRRRGLHVSTGLLFNHESPLRADKFVSQRIARGAVLAQRAAGRGKPFQLDLGSLSAVVDWGWAPDYVEAMKRIAEHEVSDDYVIATGTPHTIADFCRIAFDAVGLDSARYVVERRERLTRQLSPLVGDSTRLRQATGWQPSVTFETMVQRLVAAQQAVLSLDGAR